MKNTLLYITALAAVAAAIMLVFEEPENRIGPTKEQEIKTVVRKASLFKTEPWDKWVRASYGEEYYRAFIREQQSLTKECDRDDSIDIEVTQRTHPARPDY